MNFSFEKMLAGFLGALILVTPLLFGSAHPWAYKLAVFSAFFLLAARLLKAGAEGRLSYIRTPLLVFLPLSLTFFLVQAVPLPSGVAEALSPGLGPLRQAAGLGGGAAALALYPWAAKEQALLILSALAVFFLIINTVRTGRQITPLVNAAIGAGVLLVFLALAQRVSAGYASFLPFINKNHYAGYMELLVPMAAAMSYISFSGLRTGDGLKNSFLDAVSKKDGTLAILYALAAALLCLSAILTYSRGGIFGMFFSIIVAAAMLAGRNRRGLSLAAVAAAVLVFSVVLVKADEGKLLSRVQDLAKGDQSAALRYDIWSDTARMIGRFPAAGVGLGGFETAYPAFRTIKLEANVFQPESDYLYVLAEAGIAGAVIAGAFLCVFLWKVLALFRDRRDRFSRGMAAGCVAGLAALLLHGLVDTSLHMPAVMLLAAILMGLAYAAAGLRSGGGAGREWLAEKEVVLGPGGRRAALIGAALSLFVSGTALAGSAADLLYRSALNEKARFARADGAGPEDYRGIIGRLKTASMLDPGRAEYSFEEGRAYMWLADYAAAMEAMKAPAPGLETPRSYNEKALACFRRSAAANPYSSFPRLMAGRVLEHGLGDAEDGEREYRAARALNPSSLTIKKYLAAWDDRKPGSAPAGDADTAGATAVTR